VNRKAVLGMRTRKPYNPVTRALFETEYLI
jgi:hypothetical protein